MTIQRYGGILVSGFGLAMAMAVATSATAQTAGRVHTSFVCEFPTKGTVSVEWSRAGAWITADGDRHPASSGSYFYQTTDDAGIVMMFGPGASMERWTYQDASGIPEDATSCVRGEH